MKYFGYIIYLRINQRNKMAGANLKEREDF